MACNLISGLLSLIFLSIFRFLMYECVYLQANTLRLYLTCIKNTLEAAMCLQVCVIVARCYPNSKR
uniref:Uncharacterized protein n=1 Tax=Rhizophora mucronata TaxID=61149 RepID=A0A2P2LFP9_RHIMU